MAKAPAVTFVLPTAVAANAYLDQPDDKAPENASFKPDGKFKVTMVYDDATPLAPAIAKVRAAAEAKWPDVDFDEFAFPWKELEDDHKKEAFRGKTVVTVKSKFKPVVEDTKGHETKVKVFGGDIIKAGVTVYLYEKTEKVKVGKKTEDVTVRGASLQLGRVRLIEKRGGQGGNFDFGDDEGFTDDGSSGNGQTEGGAGGDDF